MKQVKIDERLFCIARTVASSLSQADARKLVQQVMQAVAQDAAALAVLLEAGDRDLGCAARVLAARWAFAAHRCQG